MGAEARAAGGEDASASVAYGAGGADRQVVALPVTYIADCERPEAPVEYAALVIVDLGCDVGVVQAPGGFGEF